MKGCCVQGLPWYPADADQFDWAMQTYQNWHQDDPAGEFLSFPWPEPGEVPDIPGRHFVPTDKEKAKIQWFVDNFGGEDQEEGMKGMVELAKVVLVGINKFCQENLHFPIIL